MGRSDFLKKRTNLQERIKRRTNIAYAIRSDSRESDRKNGRKNDLTIEFIRSLIADPCAYCGETSLRMTLDRKDNSLGHEQSNVIQACERCNYSRRNMPFEAWMVVADAMRKARELGLFGDWTGAIHRRAALETVPEIERKPREHGTLYGYKFCSPPCVECRRAYRDYMREWRKKRTVVQNDGSLV